jgi:uncharacterized membrane protein
MTAGRWVLVGTFAVVMGLGAWLVISREQADKVTGVVTALAAVAAVGVAVWAAVRVPQRSGAIVVSNTGSAKAARGRAIAGFSGKFDSEEEIRVDHTGDTEAEDGGESVSGINRTV